MTRKPPNMREKLAAALLEIKTFSADGKLVPVIDRIAAKSMTAEQIITQFECDHWPIRVVDGGSNHPTNLKWLGKKDHRQKTAKRDIPEIAKSKRITKGEYEFRRRMLAKSETGVAAGAEEGTVKTRAKRAWPSRPLQSRGFK